MSEGRMDAAVSFVGKQLRKNPDTTLAEMKRIGKAEGFSIYPVIMSKARAELGITAKRGRRAGSKGKSPRRKVGRPAKAASATTTRAPARRATGLTSDPVSAIQELATHMKELESEVASLRSALASISQIAAAF